MGTKMHRTTRFSECLKFMPDMDAFFVDEEYRLVSETSPSEDIWKKFEFLPTPPRSPHRGDCESPSRVATDAIAFNSICNDYERFNLVSDFLVDDDLEYSWRLPLKKPDIKSDIITDCMWSGRSAVANAICKPVATAEATPSPVVAPPLSPIAPVFAHCAPPFEVVPATAECVEPYPLSDHSYHVIAAKEEVKDEVTTVATPVKDYLGVQTPSDSDDEVDVETVGEKLVHKPRTRRGSLPSLPSPQVQRQLQRVVALATRCTRVESSKPAPCPRDSVATPKTTKATSAVSNNAVKRRREQRKRSYHYHHLRRSRKVAMAAKIDKEQQPDGKKRKWKCVVVKENVAVAAKKSRWSSSRTSSDSEDLDKRKEHNDLERRRRNDLKSSFQFLRKNVPELQDNERAPKVLILRKAVEFIRQLHAQSEALEKKRKNEERRLGQLQRRCKSVQRITSKLR